MNKENKNNTLAFTIALFILSLLLLAASQFFMKVTSSSPWDGVTKYNLDNLNFIDRSLAHAYNHKLHKLGDITCGINLILLPFIVLIFSVVKSDKKWMALISLILIYLTSFFFGKTIYDFIKSSVERIRPYMYFENPSPKGIANGDFQHSFPSGHTFNACMGAAFVTMSLLLQKHKGAFTKIIIILAYTMVLTTGCLRILSGNHFFTDVLTGALLGTLEGYGVSLLNARFGTKLSLLSNK